MALVRILVIIIATAVVIAIAIVLGIVIVIVIVIVAAMQVLSYTMQHVGEVTSLCYLVDLKLHRVWPVGLTWNHAIIHFYSASLPALDYAGFPKLLLQSLL